ncbi:NB-ARC domains-containing protein, partial [Tanacetum coccineum]
GGGQKLKSVSISGSKKLLLKEGLGEGGEKNVLLINSRSLPMLESVWMEDYPDVASIIDFGAEAATNWSQLSHLHLPSSLTRLGIINFEKLESFSEGLQHLTSLQHLYIGGCLKMKDLPVTLLHSLLSLRIIGCPNLKERCNERGGSYWTLISHIPCILT